MTVRLSDEQLAALLRGETYAHDVPWSVGAMACLRELQDARAREAPICPDCGIPKYWCVRVTSNHERCWRWDYERFEEQAALCDEERSQHG